MIELLNVVIDRIHSTPNAAIAQGNNISPKGTLPEFLSQSLFNTSTMSYFRRKTILTLTQEDYVLSFYQTQSVAAMAEKLEVPKTAIYSYLRNRKLDFMRVKGGVARASKVAPGCFDVDSMWSWI